MAAYNFPAYGATILHMPSLAPALYP